MKVRYLSHMNGETITEDLSHYVSLKLQSHGYGSGGAIEIMSTEIENLRTAFAALVEFVTKPMKEEEVKQFLLSMGIYHDEDDELEIIKEKTNGTD